MLTISDEINDAGKDKMMNTTLKQLSSVSKLYDDWAEHYDADCISIPAYAHLDRVYKSILDKYAMELEQDLTVELGCGTGIHSSLLAKNSSNVVAIDISIQCIRVAKDKVTSKGLGDRIQFIRCDAMHLPIRDNVAKSVVSLGLLTCHTDGCRQILSEMSRILCHGGYFIVDVQNRYSFNLLYYLVDALTKGHLLRLGFTSMKDFRNYLKNGKIAWIYRDGKNCAKRKIPFATFSLRELQRMLSENKLIQNELYGAHLFTLLVPLEYQEMRLPKRISSAILFLGRLEKFVKNVLAWFSSVIIVVGRAK